LVDQQAHISSTKITMPCLRPLDKIVNNALNTLAKAERAALATRSPIENRSMAQRKNNMHKRTFLKISALAAATMLSMPLMAYAQNATLKIGFVGVTGRILGRFEPALDGNARGLAERARRRQDRRQDLQYRDRALR
jgi:hypothetical protein